jgi:hypothetical protein
MATHHDHSGYGNGICYLFALVRLFFIIYNVCPFLFDASEYGGICFWCENSKNPGVLGQ